MVTRRELLLGFGLGTLSSSFPLLAQQSKVARIGILVARSRPTAAEPDPFWGLFVQGMRELGYVEGKNLSMEWRYAEGKHERLAGLAAELVQLKPSVIVTHGTPAEALKQASTTIPVVVATFSDPVSDGFAKSLARPGGNFTGLSLISAEISAKRVELLRTMLPTLSRIAVLMDPGLSYHPALLQHVQAAARTLAIQVVPVEARNLPEIERAFETMAREGVQATIVPEGSLFVQHRRRIGEIAIKHRIATMFGGPLGVRAGMLIGYGADTSYAYRRAADYVDKILKGARPGDLPIEQPTKFFLALNAKTAKVLGITIPREMLVRADEVIE
jgi:ABC-type uncharacterized transport system substrate-binding protein